MRGDEPRAGTLSEDTEGWAAVIAETVSRSEAEVVEQCCRYGLLNYEEALDAEG